MLAVPDAPPAAPRDLSVVGVVVGTTPDRSSAILTSGGRTRVVAVGETAFGGRLVSVGADAVTLEFGGERVELRLPAAAAAPSPAAPGPRPLVLPPGAPPEDPETPAREMSRVEVQRRLGEEIPRILAETAVAPVMEEGRVVGVQITRLPEGSLLTDAGLRAGDVLTRINGTDIDGMATLIGLWPRLQSATELRATVLRNGQPFSLLVSLR
ncbi:MAG TPA: type II secretion system protein N [Vicinamibacteria bacterium]|nr:type II secretion system protein N [Vicinamibacteria bacterium]